jgi:hypothetical protein
MLLFFFQDNKTIISVETVRSKIKESDCFIFFSSFSLSIFKIHLTHSFLSVDFNKLLIYEACTMFTLTHILSSLWV